MSVASIREDVRSMKIEKSEQTRFITFTLKPKYYKFKSNMQRELTQHEICSKLREYTTEFVMTCELTKQGNIHYHAIAVFKNQVQFIKWNDLLKGKRSLGYHRVTPNAITQDENMVRSKEYLLKDLEQTSKIINVNFIMTQRSDYIFNI